MTTRSGKRYLPPYKCSTCRTFWGHETYDFKCSHCATNGKNPTPPPSIEERVAKLNKWVSTQNFIDQNHPSGKNLLTMCKKMCNMRLFILIQSFKSKGYLLKSEDALKLLENGDTTRGHIVASSVIDWWNIKTANAGGKWPPYLVCYYGDYDAPPPRNMPPRAPRAMLSCIETNRLISATERFLFDASDDIQLFI